MFVPRTESNIWSWVSIYTRHDSVLASSRKTITFEKEISLLLQYFVDLFLHLFFFSCACSSAFIKKYSAFHLYFYFLKLNILKTFSFTPWCIFLCVFVHLTWHAWKFLLSKFLVCTDSKEKRNIKFIGCSQRNV